MTLTPGEEGRGTVYIGLDLGTSGLKAVALGASGTILAQRSVGYPTHRPVAGAYEQDTGDWLRAAERALAQVAGVVPPGTWRAIGLTGMIPTLVTLGPDRPATGPAVTWQDSRALEPQLITDPKARAEARSAERPSVVRRRHCRNSKCSRTGLVQVTAVLHPGPASRGFGGHQYVRRQFSPRRCSKYGPAGM